MARLTIPNIAEEVHRVLRVRATRHGTQHGGRMRRILVATIRVEGLAQPVSLLATRARGGGLRSLASRT